MGEKFVPAGVLHLFDLVAPELLLGFNLPTEIDALLKFAEVGELHMSEDDEAVVYSGQLVFDGAGPRKLGDSPKGARWEWDGARIGFRLTVPRQGAEFVRDGVNAIASASPGVRDLVATFGPEPDAVGSEYPGFAFRLELLFDVLRFVLPEDWIPGKVDESGSGWVVRDPSKGDRVKLILPRLVLGFELAQDPGAGVRTFIGSWGDQGFDAPSDLTVGELCRMDPPIAMHESGRFAIGLDTIAVDFSPDHTPPELLEYFGVDEGWQGFYFKEVRVLFSDESKDVGVHFGVKDMLISLAGEVSMEGQVAILGEDPNEFDVKIMLYEGDRGRELPAGGTAALRRDGRIHAISTGGVPPLRARVTLGDHELTDPDGRGYAIPAAVGEGTHLLHVDVTDRRGGDDGTVRRKGLLVIGPAASLPPPESRTLRAFEPARPATVQFTHDPFPPGYSLSHVGSEGTREAIVLTAPPGASAPEVTVGGTRVPVTGDRFEVDVPEGTDRSPREIQVTYPSAPMEPVEVLFDYDRPERAPGDPTAPRQDELDRYVAMARVAQGDVEAREPSQLNDSAFARSIGNFLRAVANRQVNLTGRSSAPGTEAYNVDLSRRRLAIVRHVLQTRQTGTTIISETPQGESGASDTSQWQRVEAHAAGGPDPAVVLRARIGRTTSVPEVPEERGTREPSPPRAPEQQNEKPPIFRKLGFRFRLERNFPVMMELSIRLDTETELEGRMRSLPMSGNAERDPRSGRDERLNLSDDGVVDLVLGYTWDTATRRLSEHLAVRAAPNDQDGLVHFDNRDGSNALQNIFGGISLLLPVINSAAPAVAENPDSTGDWVALVGATLVPAVLGGMGWLQTRRWVFYGFELLSRQYVPEGEDASLTDFGVILDYKVEFQIHIRLGDTPLIDSTRNMSARYKAIGFNLHFEKEDGGWKYQPIFDTSKGYELDLGDPGVFSLPAPLGDILRIHSIRVARFNPLTLDLDLGLKVDLGVVSVDRLKIKWPIEPLEAPTILPTGVSIDIPNAITGKGHLNFDNGFEGSIDITIVPIKLRVAASLAIKNVEDPATGRNETAVFAALIVEFPSPIVIGATGLGIYGLSGLFGMHYKRLEDPPNPDEAVGPALKWLRKADGQPAQLYGPRGDRLWGPAIDRWSFGVGLIAGTIEGGTLINLTGTFVLELPGPRILIFVKVQILSAKPKSTKNEDVDVTVGILGVVDLDFENGRITVGVIIDYEAKDLITLRLPVEIFFNLRDGNDWHLDIGTIRYPVEAKILGFAKATAFLMLHGDPIEGFPIVGPNGPETKTLPGVALALGIEAALVLGDEGCGIYLKVAAGLRVGISFSPFYLAGDMYLLGELRLLIVSIEAEASLAVIYATDPREQVYVHGIVRGKVDLGLFSIEGSVSFTLNSPPELAAPPPLVSGMWLQSFAPVLTTGQGGDRPIDASLGTGLTLSGSALPSGSLPGIFGTVRTGTGSRVGPGTLTDNHDPATQPHLDMPVNAYKGMWLRTDEDGAFYRIESNTATEFRLRRVDVTPGAAIPAPRAEAVIPAAGGYTVFRGVPIDTVPVLQMIAAPVTEPAPVTFTEPLRPVATTREGWVEVSGDRKNRYFLTAIELAPALPAGTPRPKTAWRREQPRSIVPQQAETNAEERRNQNVDLALLSEVPSTTPYAHERSRELDEKVEQQFGDLCQPVSPPAPVLWTFCGEPLGTSGRGWTLRGTAQPDPPGTRRSSSPNLRLVIREPGNTPAEQLVDMLLAEYGTKRYVSARVLGENQPPMFQVRPEVLDVIRRQRIVPGIEYIPDLQLRGDLLKLQPGALEVTPTTPTPQPSASVVTPTLTPLVTTRIPQLSIPTPSIPTPSIPTPSIPKPSIPTPSIPVPVPVPVPVPKPQPIPQPQPQPIPQPQPQPIPQPIPQPQPQPAPQPGPTPSEVKNWRCLRALQLPWYAPSNPKGPDYRLPGSEFAIDVWKEVTLEDRRWIELHTGRALLVTLLLGVEQRAYRSMSGGGAVLIREYDDGGRLLREHPLGSLSRRQVTGTATGLPSSWTVSGGPWTDDVLAVSSFIASLVTFERFMVDLVPHDQTTRIRIQMNPQSTVHWPAVVLGAVEVTSRAEVDRAAHDNAVQDARRDEVSDFLDASDIRPLLTPNTAYVLRVRYRAESQAPAPDSPASAPITQSFDKEQAFCFFTDDRPPPRLDPWVLGTTPEHEAKFHFADEPVSLLFNDRSIVELFQRYGKELRMVLRPAGGKPGTAPGEPVDPARYLIRMADLRAIAGTFGSPFRDALERLRQVRLACLSDDVPPPTHAASVAPFELKPLMAYTLDVEAEPADPRDPGAVSTPLYRRSFQTSRFRNMAQLAANVRGARLTHRCLSARLVLPTPPAGESCVTLSDLDIEAALVAAGDEPRPGAEQAGVILLWTPSGSDHVPQALLIDAPEPLWRTRTEPQLQPVPGRDDEEDKSFQLILPTQVNALEIVETATSAVEYFVRSSAGTRTLVVLRPPTATTQLALALRRSPSVLFSLAEETTPLIDIPIALTPPWQE